MDRTLRNWHIALAAAGILVCGGGFYLEMVTAHAAKVQSAELKADSRALQATFQNLNRPCRGKAGPDACGTLAQINKTTIDVGDAVVTMQRQVAETGKLTDAAARGIARASNDLHNTSVAAQGAVGSLKADLDAAKPAIVNLAALEAALTKDAATLQTTEKSLNDSIAPITANLEKLTFHTAGIAEDTHKVTHHFEQEIDSPKPKTFMQKVGVAWKIIWQAAMLAK